MAKGQDTIARGSRPIGECKWQHGCVLLQTYQRIKANRQGRLRIKNRKRKADEATCPVCNERVQGSVEELNGHVEMCLRKGLRPLLLAAGSKGRSASPTQPLCPQTGGAADEDENVDVEGDTEMFEEYEWAGQRRIRATTLLVGGFAAAGLATTSSRPSPVDEDVDLVVDGDDSATYGPPQYSEADVVVTSADGPRDARERDALREALISPDGSKREAQAASGGASGGAGAAASGGAAGASSGDGDAKEEGAAGAGPGQQQQQQQPSQQQQQQAEAGAGGGSGGGDGAAAASPADANPVLEALKSRIRELEGESRAGDDKFKCLICMERYKKPVISVCCWHVHCEECWLHTLVMLAGRPQPRGGERASAPGAVAVTLTIVLGGFLRFK
ncbi:Uncharacterized protein GBIM_13583 [Gryllus bimaculatus]|nr:Uncharacterized protein GBIM_13583 [Gryllus bimaculatus]